MFKFIKFNEDVERRAEILGIDTIFYVGGIQRFSGVTTEQLKALMDENFLDPKDAQNSSYTAKEFYDFMLEHPGVTAHGYAVSEARQDYRVTIEGMEGSFKTKDDLIDFIYFCRDADSLDIDKVELYAYSWWD